MQYTFIEHKDQLQAFYEDNKAEEWIGFDTEFMGEKRFQTQLCLIQVVSSKGLYIIDPIALNEITCFLQLIEDSNILKITHAGENDYRLLNQLYNTIPVNVFDTQVAAGFIGYNYPISFGKLVKAEAGLSLKKGYAATDWTKRPIEGSQLSYALNDVVPLERLHSNIVRKLKANKRYDWAMEECAKWEHEKAYQQDPNKEVLNNNMIRTAKPRVQLFLIRLLKWRTAEARKKDISREMVLPKKHISKIANSISGGLRNLQQNRLLPSRLVQKYGAQLVELFEQATTEEENALIEQINFRDDSTPRSDLMVDFLYLLVQHHALVGEISPALIIAKNGIKRMKHNSDLRNDFINCNWKKELLGEELINWLLNYDKLDFTVKGGIIEIKTV